MLLRRIARPLLAGIFITGGVAALRDPKSHVQLAGPALEPVLDKVSGVAPIEQPPSAITLVKVDAGIKIGAGVLLATGKAPRLAAGALAATLVPTTAFGHRFWEIDDPDQRTNQQIHFMKNLGLLGGLLLAAADTEGKPSLAWRARRAGRTSAVTAELFHRDVTEGVSGLSKRAGELGEQAADVAGRYTAQAADLASKYGPQAADVASKYTAQAADVAGKYTAQAADLASRYGPQAAEVASKYTAQAADLAGRYGPQAADLAGKAGERLVQRRERLQVEAEKLSSRAAKRAEKAGKRARKAGKRAQKAARKSTRQLRS